MFFFRPENVSVLNKTRFYLLLIWVSLCLSVLVLSLLNIDDQDIGIIFILLMAGLTFPIGAIAIGGIVYLTQSDFLVDIYVNQVGWNCIFMVLIWLVIVTIGYVQWFGIFPKLTKYFHLKWKDLDKKKTSEKKCFKSNRPNHKSKNGKITNN